MSVAHLASPLRLLTALDDAADTLSRRVFSPDNGCSGEVVQLLRIVAKKTTLSLVETSRSSDTKVVVRATQLTVRIERLSAGKP